MVSDAAYAGAYWGPRESSAEQIADRVTRFCISLSALSPLLASWRTTGHSLADSRPVDLDVAALEPVVQAGEVRMPGSEGTVGDSLGYTFSLWNGDQDTSVGLQVTAGAARAIPGASSNTVVLKLPEPTGAGASLYTRETALAVMRAMVNAWEPDWATWTTKRLRRAQDAQPGDVIAGWATYTATAAGGPVAAATSTLTVERDGSGLLITLPDTPIDVVEADVLAVSRSLRRPLATS